MYCPNCGCELKEITKFCTNCGTKLLNDDKIPSKIEIFRTENHKVDEVSNQSITQNSDENEGKGVSILLYILPVIGIIWYFVDQNMRKNKFATYHAKQSITLIVSIFIFCFVYGIIYFILSFLLAFIPILGWILIILLALPFFMPLIWIIIGLINVLKGEEKPLPIIGHFAVKIKL